MPQEHSQTIYTRNEMGAQKSNDDGNDNINYTIHISVKKLYNNDQQPHLEDTQYRIETIPNNNKSG